MEKLEVEVMM